MSVFKTIAKVRAEIGSVEKNGKNTFHNYKYQSWEDILPKVRTACEKHGLLILPSTADRDFRQVQDAKGKDCTQAFIDYQFKLVDVATGESETLNWVGEAVDSSDKATNKAGTAAYKCFCLKLFQITTKDDEDPDASSPVVNSEPPDIDGYVLPLTDSQIKKAKKMAEEGGLDWEDVKARCKVRNLSSAVKVSELIREMLQVPA